MDKWEYRTLYLSRETWHRGSERYEDYVLTYPDGTRLEGLEMIMRRYLDDGGWELVTTVPVGFKMVSPQDFIADILMVIFRRKFSL